MAAKSFTPSASGLEGQTIDAGRLLLVRLLGEGGYGVVYLAVEQQGNSYLPSFLASPKQYAVKVLPKIDSSTVEGECQSREIVAHKIVSDHPGIVTLHDIIEDEQFIFLVLDYCPGGDLFSAIIERQVYQGKDALLKSVFLQIVDAVKSCHDQGIYHRDLKPDNIFVSADSSKVFLGDFGLATDQNLSNNHRCGSSFYISPECLGEEHNFGTFKNDGNDVWSLGIILTNMITGRNPWRLATTNDDNFYHFISDPDNFIRTSLPMSEEAGELIKRIFTFNPYKRISLAKLREAVLAIDTFFPSLVEVDSAERDKRVVDEQPIRQNIIVRVKTAPATPQLPQGVADDFSKVCAYPDDEFLYPSPNPDNFDFTPMSQPITPASASTSSSSTLCGDDDYFADEYAEKIGKETRVNGDIACGSKSAPSMSTVHHLLEQWVL